MRYLLAILFIALQSSAIANCELFKEEVNVIGENIREMYSDLYDANAFIDKAKANRTESDNQKLGRYLKDIKGDVDLIEHGMSQLKLHQECACENFKFQYVDNLLIEIKFWLKKAQDVDLGKPKKTNYDAIKSNSDKALAKASDLQVYFMNPCKESKQEVEEKQEEPAPIAEATSDTTSTEEPEAVEEVMAEVTEEESAMPKDTASAPATTSEGSESSSQEETSATEGGEETAGTGTVGAEGTGAATEAGSSVTGAAVGTAAALTTGAVVAATQIGKDSTETANEAPPETGQEETAAVEPEAAMQSDSSSTEEATPTIVAEETETPTDSTNTERSVPSESSDTNMNPAMEAAAVGIIATSGEDSTETEEIVAEVEEEAQPVMDTVRHKDIAVLETAPEPEPTTEAVDSTEEIASAPAMEEPAPEPVAEAEPTTPIPAPTVAVTTKPEVIPADFHYAVQIATGNADTKSGKYAALNEDIYSVEEGGLTKYRIGKYKTLSEAKATKNKAFNGGFLDAFIVAYKDGQRIGLGEAKQMEAGKAPSSSAAPAAAAAAPKPVKVKRNSEVLLAIQIGANLSSTDPVYEIVKYERKVGMDVHVLHGTPIRFYTSPTTDQNVVETNLGRVKAKGVNEAFLIGIVDGKRVDYNEALGFLAE